MRTSISARSDTNPAVHAIYRHIFRSMRQSKEPFWVRDSSPATARRLLELTLKKREEARSREMNWIQFLALPTQAY